jgi:K+-transporting ATPase ATPase A chain
MIFWTHWMLIHGFALLIAYPLAQYAKSFLKYKANLRPLIYRWEKAVFKFSGFISQEMTWIQYLYALLQLQLIGFLLFYVLARLQMLRLGYFNPSEAFQLAASFVTNTNYLSLPGEITWGNPLFTFGVIVQSFFSAATGITVVLVMARAFIQDKQEGLGNFWQDFWRITMYLLLPLASILSLLFLTQGVPQNWQKPINIEQYASPELHQLIPMGPIATHEAIKLLGTNGGGLTSVNSAHPFENPTPFTTFLQEIAVLIIPVMCCFLFAGLLKNKRYAWAIWGMMFILSSVMGWGAYFYQAKTMLGIETRIGLVDTVIFQVLNTSTATGASMGILDWMSPLSNGFYLLLMNLGEICFGGSGMGLINMLVVLLLTAFILNLLSGQSASFLNKNIPLSVMKLSMFYIIFSPCLILITLSLLMYSGQIEQQQPDMLSAWWYALSSWVQNNGGAYVAGIAQGTWVNYLSGILMLCGRYVPIMLVMTMAGIIDTQSLIPSEKTVFHLDRILFCGVALLVIVVVTLLAFLPLWSFGPLAGH